VSGSTSQPINAPALGEHALSILRQLPGVAALALDSELRVILAAGGALAHQGLDADALEGRLAASVIEPDRWAIYEPLCRKALRGTSQAVEVWSGDETSCYALQVGPWSDEHAHIHGVLLIAHDITQRKHSEEARRHAQERFELIFEQSPNGMALVTVDGRLVRVNNALLEITGYSAQELLHKTLDQVTHPDDAAIDLAQVNRLLSGEIENYQIEKRYLHARGHVIRAKLSVALVRDRQGKPQHFIAQIQDDTADRMTSERLQRLADRDPLTGARNRKVFEQELDEQVSRSRQRGDQAALLLLGLDDFRLVNQTYGHKTGDALLKAITVDLEQRLRGTDLLARLGGDEFAVLLRRTSEQAAVAVAEDLARVVGDCGIEALGKRASCEASVGVAGIERGVVDSDAVLIAAEKAMYAAKLKRRG
jgi:diguanylate cyclase (GGDEF)-like protein/PAS domain S-box-containing protein